MAAIDNLTTLHKHEEELRAQSLHALNARADLRDHLQIISEAMNAIWAFSHDHDHQSDDELTLQLLGIRLFNAAGAALKLGLSGYYQKAFDAVRDLFGDIVSDRLLKDLPSEDHRVEEREPVNPDRALWSRRDPQCARQARGFTSGARKKAYDVFSEHASHASYPGFSLITTGGQNLGQVGPFFDEKKLAVCVSELASRLCHAALHVTADHEGADLQLLATRAHYLDAVNAWRAKYLKG